MEFFALGGIGLAVIQGARIAGARQIIVVDKIEQKIALAKKVLTAFAADPLQVLAAVVIVAAYVLGAAAGRSRED